MTILDLVTITLVGFTTVIAVWMVVNGLRRTRLRLVLSVVGTVAVAGMLQVVVSSADATEARMTPVPSSTPLPPDPVTTEPQQTPPPPETTPPPGTPLTSDPPETGTPGYDRVHRKEPTRASVESAPSGGPTGSTR